MPVSKLARKSVPTSSTSRWLDRRNPAGGRKSPLTKIVRTGIKAALERGPATTREIRDRMGVAPTSTAINTVLRAWERKGIVKQIGSRLLHMNANLRTQAAVWALVEEGAKK